MFGQVAVQYQVSNIMVGRSDMITKKHEEVAKELRRIVIRGAEFLCKSSQHGTWVDTRTDASCTWALFNCGLGTTQPRFLDYCAREIINNATRETIEDDGQEKEGICWNSETWDTALATIAVISVGGERFQGHLDKITNWFAYEYDEDGHSFESEPWETLWGVWALIMLRKYTDVDKTIIRKGIDWTLGKRFDDGLLISPHYMGLLLSTLSAAKENRTPAPTRTRIFNKAIDESIDWLLNELKSTMKRKAIWSNEPWINGFILHGLASNAERIVPLFENLTFNKILIEWSDDLWSESKGWYDVTDTADMLRGLSEYYINLELYIRRSQGLMRSDILEGLASKVDFQFREKGLVSMKVYPIWRGRTFKTERKKCCLIMPFRESWSNDIHEIVRNICKICGFEVIRPDELTKRDVIEGIWTALNEASIVIAECTGHNSNVFYEMGIAQTLGKDVIILAQDAKIIPYDIQFQRVIEYKVEDAKTTLAESLPKMLSKILSGEL